MRRMCMLHLGSRTQFYRSHSLIVVVIVAFFCVLPAFGSPTVTGYVRVNQIGYEAGVAMRAYLMTSRRVSGVGFAVTNAAGQDVITGSVSAPVSATSPGFPVDTPENLYGTPLENNLYFYENERDGSDFIPTPLRTAAGHLNDASAAVYKKPQTDNNDNFIGSLIPTGETINAEGGWWDAGDYLKFVQTHSYVVALMLIGVRDFPRQMGM